MMVLRAVCLRVWTRRPFMLDRSTGREEWNLGLLSLSNRVTKSCGDPFGRLELSQECGRRIRWMAEVWRQIMYGLGGQ